MDFTQALKTVLGTKAPRPGQVMFGSIAARGQHVAALAPTGSGKSVIAAALAVQGAEQGIQTVVGVHSNGLVSQYLGDFPEWADNTGLSFAVLVGAGHYHCPKSSPQLAGLTEDQKEAVRKNDGLLIGCGLDPRNYWTLSLKGLVPELDEDENDEDDEKAKGTPCKTCEFNLAGTCPLLNARKAASEADLIVTNDTLLGLALDGKGPLRLDDDAQIVLDEAHAAAQPIREVLSNALTIRRSAKLSISADDVAQAAAGPNPAKDLLRTWADDESHPMCRKARGLFAASKGRGIEWTVEDDKVRLFVPCDLTEVWAERRVVAMSGTLTQPMIKDLGLSATVVRLPGLDVSANEVEIAPCPTWSYADKQAWAECVAERISSIYADGCRALVLFVSNADLDLVTTLLPSKVRAALIKYSSQTDRVDAIARYRANPDKHILVGFSSGAGTGVNLPGELLRTVVVTRVPQAPPMGADRAKWARETTAAVVQSVGRGHRTEDDWCKIVLLNGYGKRTDVRDALKAEGWKV